MRERPENFDPAYEDAEATLATPRFDAEEARRAHPVVPLVGAPKGASDANPRTPGRRMARALLAVALLAVAAVGGALATKFMQSRRAEQTPEPVQGQKQEQVQEQTQTTPAQTAPAQTAAAPQLNASAPVAKPAASPAAEPVTEEVAREETPANGPAPREMRTRRVEATSAPKPERELEDRDGDDRGGRGRSAERRRGRDDDAERRHGRDDDAERRHGRDDDSEKEMRRASKRTREKAPRLVDVLTRPPRPY